MNMAARSRKTAIYFNVYYTLTFSIRGGLYLHFFVEYTYAGHTQMENGKEMGREFWMWEWE